MTHDELLTHNGRLSREKKVQGSTTQITQVKFRKSAVVQLDNKAKTKQASTICPTDRRDLACVCTFFSLPDLTPLHPAVMIGEKSKQCQK